MIKFFRRIRQQLLVENRFSKYLLYAIGEIILVVIGILIALQINNWNQDRLNRLKSQEFHLRLIDDLDLVLEQCENDSIRSKKLTHFINGTVKSLQQGSLSEEGKDTLEFTLQNFYQYVPISKTLSSYEELKSTGQLGLIYNKELRNELSEYLGLLEAISIIYDRASGKVNNTEFLDPYLTIHVDPDSYRNNTFDYDFDAMAQDKTLINTFSRYAEYWQTKTTFAKILARSTVDIRDKIAEEVE